MQNKENASDCPVLRQECLSSGAHRLAYAASLLACAVFGKAFAQSPVSTDLWDVGRGAVITASSPVNPFVGTVGGLLGGFGQNNFDPATWTYFADELPEGSIHFVEWETPGDVTIGQVRIFAFGDADLNFGREFAHVSIKAKSPGSSTYDLTVVDFTPAHPYELIDWDQALMFDESITPVTARSFRIEFLQYTAGWNFDGPRIIEIDGLPVPIPPRDVPSLADDLWDITQGSVITASSGFISGAGAPAGMFGQNGQANLDGSSWTYFADGQPENFVHFVEWETPQDVVVGQIRLYALGDFGLNNSREFAQVTIKAKSTGSSNYDLTLLTFTPTHPYIIYDPFNFLILDETVTPVAARSFRAEFLQYNAGRNFDGPRIVELDALPGALPPPPPPSQPVITANPEGVTANIGMPFVLSVEATGTGELQYQWFKDSNPLQGANTESLFISSLSASDAGSYQVTVTDSIGTAQSSAAVVNVELVHIVPSSFDLWDVNLGGTVSAQSDLQAGSAPNGLFDDGETDFADSAEGAVHFVEWNLPAPVLVNTVRLFARGENLNNANVGEFSSFTLKAKSPGSTTFDILVGTFTPVLPYTLLDSDTAALLDVEIAPIQATAFRAEFVQYGSSGPRVVELDAFGTRPLVLPAVIVQPESLAVARNTDTALTVLARGGNLQYQWRFNGANIAGANSDTLLVRKMNKQGEGSYSVVVWNQLGSVESAAATLTIQKKH